jgi:hypothetical protein
MKTLQKLAGKLIRYFLPVRYLFGGNRLAAEPACQLHSSS